MAKLMSKKTREIVQTIAVIVIILLLVGFYIVYPLITVSKMVSRPDKDKFDDPEFQYANNDSFFIDSGLTPDTFAISTDDNIRLAALYFYPDTAIIDSITGTVILIHSDNKNRTSLFPYIRPLLNAGLAVVIYDQRGSGFSGGKFRTAGIYEADDLVQLIVDLNFHDQLYPPLTVAGFGVGGDAAIYASQKDKRINGVVAIDPYLTSTRWLSILTKRHHLLAIPLYKMVYFWWYQKLTGFPFSRTGVDDIRPIETKTILIASQSELEEPEYQRFIELSPEEVTTVSQAADSSEKQSQQLILEYILFTAGIPTPNLK
jgi:pimeloyl-ACP methyl ester carboxylesterase